MHLGILLHAVKNSVIPANNTPLGQSYLLNFLEPLKNREIPRSSPKYSWVVKAVLSHATKNTVIQLVTLPWDSLILS